MTETEQITGASDAAPVSKASDNMSIGELSRSRIETRTQLSEQNNPEPEAADPALTEGAGEVEDGEDYSGDDVLSQSLEAESEDEAEGDVEETQDSESAEPDGLNIDELTDEQIHALADKIGKGAPKRISELIARAKTAEEQLAQLSQKSDSDPFEDSRASEDNPFKDIQDVNALQEKYRDATETIEWAEDHLLDAEDYGADDVVTEAGDQEFTKRQLREILRNAKKAAEKHLPAQHREIQRLQQYQALEKQLQDRAKQELTWMASEDNDIKQQYQMLVEDPKVKKAKEQVPEIAPFLDYLIAHASNSKFGQNAKQSDEKAKKPAQRLKPPSNPSNSGGQSSNPEKRNAKRLKELTQRYQQTGRASDLAALRAAQFSN